MKTKTKSLFIISSIIFFVLLAVISFAFYKIKIRTNSVRQYYANEIQKNNVESFNKLKTEKKILDEFEKTFFKTFLQENELVSFITKLELDAKNSSIDITIDKVEKGDQETSGSYVIQPISFFVTLRGNYVSIQEFILQNLQQQKILQLKEIKLYNISENDKIFEAKIILTGNSISQ